ncbi:hypothetical protein Patl1_35038 [Pistacia atlantica]|uniref:Uncharacterized protein n=1 Tax=Pistacia atlantica TaxID=434234 RepID=A0ACC0ZXH5_9ROSI|nr:hypothetical protein Patl1_35038 [Pistacia atlantica]
MPISLPATPPLLVVLDESLEFPFKISFHVMFGTLSFAYLRFVDQLNGASIQIFVDGGSTLNFIQPRVAKYLGLAIEAVLPPTTMVVGDGAKGQDG